MRLKKKIEIDLSSATNFPAKMPPGVCLLFIPILFTGYKLGVICPIILELWKSENLCIPFI